MTDLLYHADSYLREFDAVVGAASESGVVLDRTAFYAAAGGQPADMGTLRSVRGDEYQVVDVRRVEGQVVHVVDGHARPRVGEVLHGTIDWARRYDLMRTHTAMHVLCGVVWRDFRAQVTGGNMEPLTGRLDFELERMERALVDQIERAINAEVSAERPVRARTVPRDQALQIPDLIRTKVNLLPPGIERIRVVEIEGLDLQADGGTHVANTREVGALRIADYKSKGRLNKRLVVRLEPRA